MIENRPGAPQFEDREAVFLGDGKCPKPLGVLTMKSHNWL